MEPRSNGTFPERARAAFLGLALGDAYGAPLEFIRGEAVRTAPVALARGQFRWTDDTHMSLYLAKAILDLPAGPLDPDRFGHAVAKRFVEWSRDPLTPDTAPGFTCMKGVDYYRMTGDWATSGLPSSDGCGAVMRICPLPMVFQGEELLQAAAISAQVTHAHPNAVDSAVAASFLLRLALERGELHAGMLRETVSLVGCRPGHGDSVIRALEAAIGQAEFRHPWLDEAAIPDGDGGWRSPSCLGLAVTAALGWEGSFEKVVDRAARIHGDSDSVACLAGMYLGAAYGPGILPEPWLEVLPERQTIESLADRLCRRSR